MKNCHLSAIAASIFFLIGTAQVFCQPTNAPVPSPVVVNHADNKETLKEFGKRVDESLKPEVSSALAGLALAAAAFLIPFQEKRQKAWADCNTSYIQISTGNNIDPVEVRAAQARVARAANARDAADNAVHWMRWAFYFFIVVLTTHLLFEHPASLLDFFKSDFITEWNDAMEELASFTCGISGIACLWMGARALKDMLKD